MSKVLYISGGCCTEFNIYYFKSYLFLVTSDSIFNSMVVIESGILLKNNVSCNLCKIIAWHFHSDNL